VNFQPKVQYTLKKSRKRTTTAIKIKTNGAVEVFVPTWYRKSQADLLVASKYEWILRKQREFGQRPKIEEHRYIDGEMFYYLGQKKQLEIRIGHSAAVISDDHALLVILGERAPYRKSEAQALYVKRMLHSWYKKQAEQVITPLVAEWCNFYPELGSEGRGAPGNLRFRMMKRRWGSCDHKGNLAFSTRLICAPEELVEYVVVHELCHRLDFSHQKTFYGTLSGYLPNFQECQKRLRKESGLWTLSIVLHGGTFSTESAKDLL
jgi:predicted metal-dependent hydrolase